MLDSQEKLESRSTMITREFSLVAVLARDLGFRIGHGGRGIWSSRQGMTLMPILGCARSLYIPQYLLLQPRGTPPTSTKYGLLNA